MVSDKYHEPLENYQVMIQIAETEQQLKDCYPVMCQLRPHLQLDSFLKQVRQQDSQNYRLAFIRDDNNKVVAVAGFRIATCLAWGDFLYVDDLVTDENERSKGYGKRLLDWLIDYAKQQGCQQLHLDSGVQRKDAHRFYEREGMSNMGHHYALQL
jgi:GNAT superfamily N-acetyltransferase